MTYIQQKQLEPLIFAKEIKHLLISDWVWNTDQSDHATKVQLDEWISLLIVYKNMGEELLLGAWMTQRQVIIEKPTIVWVPIPESCITGGLHMSFRQLI